MSKALHELRVRNSVDGIADNIGRGYVETLLYPGFNFDDDVNFYFEGHPTLRGEIIAMGLYNVVEVLDDGAAGDATLEVGIVGTDTDEYIQQFTAAEGAMSELAANTNDATDADAARDITRYIKRGDSVVIPADQLVGATAVEPTDNNGEMTVYVTVRWFE